MELEQDESTLVHSNLTTLHKASSGRAHKGWVPDRHKQTANANN